MLAVVSLAASLEIFDKIDESVRTAKQTLLTGYLEALVTRLLPSVEILTPPNPVERGSQLSLDCGRDARELEHQLALRGVIVDARGRIIRVAPAPLYNSYSDVHRFVSALRDLLASQS